MKKRRISKQLLAFLLVMVMIITMTPIGLFAEEGESTQTEEGSLGENLANALGAESEKMVEVKFALPEGLSEDEAAEITLPETQMIASGTLIAALPVPEWPGNVFLGWYYDAAQTKEADMYDAVERNLTLYPSFTSAQNYEDQFRINYISDQDVEPDFEIRLISYGLSREQIRELVTVKDLSKVEGEEEYTLEQAAPDLDALIADEKYRTLAREAVSKYQAGELDGTLTDALTELSLKQQEEDAREAENAAAQNSGNESSVSNETGEEGSGPEAKLDEAVIAQIVAYYAPEESEKTKAVKALDILIRAKKAGLNTKEVKPSELLEIATEEELEQTGLIVAEPEEELKNETLRKTWEETRKESLEKPVDLEETFQEDLEKLPVMIYSLRAAGGWNRGDLHQVEILDTSHLRHYRDENEAGEYVIYHNITVAQQDFNNMQLNSGIVFLPVSEVQGVDLDNGLFAADASTDGDMEVTANDDSGVLTYSGSEPINAGMTVAVYDGTLNEDGSVDGSVGYFNITEALGGGEYAYGSPEYTDVVFTPDIIPAKDDGSFDDGELLLTADQLNFSGEVYETMGLDADTVVEAGDFLAVYTGNISNPDSMELVGYGCITAVEKSGADLLVQYDPVSEGTLEQSADMYMHIDEVPVPLTEEDLEKIGEQLSEEIENSEFMEESSEYISGLIMSEDVEKPDSEYGQALQEVKFQREDGTEISLEEVQKLASGGKVEVELPIKPSVQVGLSLQHFDGTGIRAEAAAQFEITIHLNDDADIKITVVAMLELEVALGLTCKIELEWRKAWIFPYIYDISGHVGLHAGIYVGLGVTVTVQTAGAEDDSSVAELMPKDEKTAAGGERGKAYLNIKKFGQGLESIAKAAKAGEDGLHVSSIPGAVKSAKDKNGKNTKPDAETDEMHNSVGGSFEEKYANFIQESDAEYVSLLNQELITFQLPSDPLHILAISLGINFVVNFKLNVMLGASLTYGNAKEIAANFTIFHPASETTEGDLETPNFQVDFFIFGMVGIRAGIQFDLRVGALTTKLASIGVTAEVGVYLEFFGYFYVAYKWEAGSGSSTEMFGSLLLQAGLYLDINFKAQMGDGKLQKEVDLYDTRFPLLSLGDEFCALDFDIGEDDESLNIDIEEGGSAEVPDELFDIQFLEIATGDIDSDNMDRDNAVNNGGESFTAMGIPYTQMDETYFHVEYTPKGKDFGDASKADAQKGGFLYDPVSNTIYAKPNSEKDSELWGEFTFTWYQGGPGKTNSQLNYGAGFGLNTREISRTVQVHWKGVPCSATADVYLVKNRGVGLREMFRGALQRSLNGGEGALADINGVTFGNARSKYYTKKETIEFSGFDGIVYYMDLEDLQNRYPGYSVSFAKEPYDENAIAEYSKRNKDSLDRLFNGIRAGVYESEDFTGEQGWLYVDEKDTHVYFMMHLPQTKVDLFFDDCYVETDWHILDSGSNGKKTVASVMDVKVPSASRLMEAMPAAIKNGLQQNTEAYEYKLYMYSDKERGRTNFRYNGRVMTASEVYTGSNWEEIEQKGTKTQMPAFDEFIGDRSLWKEVTESAAVPANPTVVFAVRTPRSFTVTWQYDDGDVTTRVGYGGKADQPKTPARTNYIFQYWADEAGNQYKTGFTMPAKNLVLKPVFIGTAERTVTWIVDGEKKTSKVKPGINPLSSCPFSSDSKARIIWQTDPDDITSIVSDEYVMPDRDITLYGRYFFECKWVMYDTGNRKFTELTTVTDAVRDTKVMENLPQEVKNLANGRNYTYSYYRIYETDLAKVKADMSKWGKVYGSTVFYPYDTTYILQREPIMTEVTWKYDDGDVVTNNWIGRALTEPKAATRSGYDFSYWADENGKKYVSGSTRPPEGGVTLYPHFTEHPYQTNWVLYDTGNKKYQELTSEKTTLQGQKVMENLPPEVQKLLKNGNYTYSYYRIYETDLAKVKSNKSKWGKVYGSTVFYPYDTTYILQREPIMAKVTWKYDDGDIVTNNWIGRAITEPKAATRSGYDFICWADENGKEYTSGSTRPPAGGVTLYPNFVEHEHTWDAGKITTPATCVETGVKTYTCTDCGKKKTETIAIDPKNHTGGTEIRDAKEVSCSEEGYTGDTYCKSCKAKISDGQTIEKKAHTPGEAVRENVVEATCQQAGSYDEVVYCTVCNEQISRTEMPIAKKVHIWNDGEITKPSTCKEKGEKTYTCTVCGDTKTEEVDIDPDAHDWKQNNIGRTATIREGGDGVIGVLLEAGKEKKVCQLCGKEETGDDLLLTPTSESQEVSVYDLFADESWTTVADCKIPLELATVHVEDVQIKTYGLDPDRTNDQWITASFEWAEDYSSMTLSDMEKAFEQDVNKTFTLKVKVHPKPTRYSWFKEDDPSWYGRNGRYDVEGFESDFTDGEGTILITGHEHDWDYDNAVYVPHTDTSDGYYEYSCTVSGCTKKLKEIIPAGHVWETTDIHSEAYAEPVAEGTSGAMKNLVDGKWYLPHCAVVDRKCTLCDEKTQEETITALPFGAYTKDGSVELEVFAGDLISAGMTTLGTIRPSELGCVGAVRLPVKDSSDDAVLEIDGTFICKELDETTPVADIYELSGATMYCQYVFVPAEPDKFEPAYYAADELQISIKNERTEAEEETIEATRKAAPVINADYTVEHWKQTFAYKSDYPTKQSLINYLKEKKDLKLEEKDIEEYSAAGNAENAVWTWYELSRTDAGKGTVGNTIPVQLQTGDAVKGYDDPKSIPAVTITEDGKAAAAVYYPLKENTVCFNLNLISGMEYSWGWKDGSAISGDSVSVKGLYGQKYDLPVVSFRKTVTEECTTEYAVNSWSKDNNAMSGAGIDGRFGEENETLYAVNSIRSTIASDPAGTDEGAMKKSPEKTEKDEIRTGSEEDEKEDSGKDAADAGKKGSGITAADEKKTEPEKAAAEPEKAEETAEKSGKDLNEVPAEKEVPEEAAIPEAAKSPEDIPVIEEKKESSETETDPEKETEDLEEISGDEGAKDPEP